MLLVFLRFIRQGEIITPTPVASAGRRGEDIWLLSTENEIGASSIFTFSSTGWLCFWNLDKNEREEERAGLPLELRLICGILD